MFEILMRQKAEIACFIYIIKRKKRFFNCQHGDKLFLNNL